MARNEIRRRSFINFQFDNEIQKALRAHSPKVVNQALRTTFIRVTKKAVLGSQSVAMKKAFRRGSGEYMISPAKAKAAGKFRATRLRLTKTAFGRHLASFVLSGKGIGLWHFPTRKGRWQKTPIGKSGKLGKRRVVRVRVTRKGTHEAQRPRKNIAKRSGYPNPYPEFGGFLGTGKDSGASLLFTRKRKPVGKRVTDRTPLETMQTLAPSRMIIGPRTLKAINDTFKEELPKQFVQNMEFFARKAARSRGR